VRDVALAQTGAESAVCTGEIELTRPFKTPLLITCSFKIMSAKIMKDCNNVFIIELSVLFRRKLRSQFLRWHVLQRFMGFISCGLSSSGCLMVVWLKP